MNDHTTYTTYPGGMSMPDRGTGLGDYRYAYNGMEMDNEVSGNGNSYTTEFRQYDPRLMRWKSLDPLMGKYPSMSPFMAFNGNPIFFIDPKGLEGQGDYFDAVTGKKLGSDGVPDGKEYLINKSDWDYINSRESFKGLSNNEKKAWLTSAVRATSNNHQYSGMAGEPANLASSDYDKPTEAPRPAAVDQFLNGGKTKRAEAVIAKGTEVDVEINTAASAVVFNYGEVKFSAPNDAQIGSWDRKARIPYSLGLTGGASPFKAGFATTTAYTMTFDKNLTGNSFSNALQNNIWQLTEGNIGFVGYFGYLEAQNYSGEVFGSAWGGGGGVSAGFGFSPIKVNGLQTIPLSKVDSIEIAKKDTIVYKYKGGKDYLRSLGLDK